MGFFSDAKKKFKQAGGDSITAIISPSTELYSQGKSLLDDPFGTKETVAALKEAGRIEEANRLENRMLVEKILKLGEPARERANIAGKRLLDIATSPISESEDFQRDLREAQVQARFNLAQFGATGGTFEENVLGETTARAISNERNKRLNLLSYLAGGTETGIPGALGAQELATRSALSQAQTAANIGQAQAAGKQFTIQALLDIIGTGGTIAAFA